MPDMIEYMMKNKAEIFRKIENRVYRKRDSFHIGTVTRVNTDNTCTIKSLGDEPITEVTSMNGEVPYAGTNMLYLSGNEKTPVQGLGISPWFVGSYPLETD